MTKFVSPVPTSRVLPVGCERMRVRRWRGKSEGGESEGGEGVRG